MPDQARGYPPVVKVRVLLFGEGRRSISWNLERREGMEGADAEGFEAGGCRSR